MRRVFSRMALLAFSVHFPALPDDVKDLGPKIYQAQWVSVAKLPEDPSSLIPFPWGDDPLTDGEIEVRAKGQVKVELEDAAPEVSYTLLVCQLSNVAERCTELGLVPTDDKGRANAVVPWPQDATGPHAVFFVLRRDDKTMFVSGFHMPSGVPPVAGNPPAKGPNPEPPQPEWKEVEIKGAIDSVGSGSFVVGDLTILVDGNTRYAGQVKDFSDLKAGMRVKVHGTSLAGGILAVRVDVSGKM